MRIGKPCNLKGRDEAFVCCVTFLKEAVFDADFICKIKNPLIFRLCDFAAQLRKLCRVLQGGVLIHDADIDVISVDAVEISKDSLGISDLSGKYEMPYKDAGLHQAGRFVKCRRSGLTEHFPDGVGRLGKIVGGVGIGVSETPGIIFEIRQPDIHKPLQKPEGGDLLVAAGVVYYGDGQAFGFCKLKGAADLGNKMTRGHKVDICSPLLLKFQKYFRESFRGDGVVRFSGGDGVILAEDAL